MGKLSRNKGKTFERRIAAMLREAFPDLAPFIHRSSQAHGDPESPGQRSRPPGWRPSQTFDSDVTGIPGLWIECQDAREPTPLAKLMQAERDVRERAKDKTRIPIAIVHRTGTKFDRMTVTMRLNSLLRLDGGTAAATAGSGNIPVTIEWAHFLELCDRTQPWLM